MNARARLAQAVRHTVEQLENRLFLSASTWVINGDLSRTAPNDTIVLDIDPATGTAARASINGRVVGTRPLASLTQISINAGRGDDAVYLELGEAGDDILVRVRAGDGNDTVMGDAGNQSIDAGAGDDYIEGAGGNDSIWGGAGNDEIAGGDGNDWIDAGAGDDSISGGWGMDRILGGGGSDQIDGGEGRDKIASGDGSDIIKGGSGRDAYDGGAGRNWLYVQPGYDTYVPGSNNRIRTDDGKLPMLRSGKGPLAQRMRDLSLQNWSSYLGTRLNYGWWTNATLATAFNAGTPILANSGGNNDTTPTPDHSNTNTQEEGVDEADIVETDGNWVYTLINNELVVTDANNYRIAWRQRIDGYYSEGMYLIGDKLAVITWDYTSEPVADGSVSTPGFIMPYVWREFCRVNVYNVSDPTAPALVEQTEVDGDYVDSRAIGDRIYLEVSNDIQGVNPLISSDGNGGLQYESRDHYLARLDSAIDQQMPGYTGRNAHKQTASGSLIGDNTLWTEESDYNWYYQPVMSIAMLDVSDGVGDVTTSANIGGWGGQLYVSGHSLYIAKTNWDNAIEQTKLYKFLLGTDSVILSATGRVDGHVLNQFSMDEEGQYIRIATTIGWGGETSSSEVNVLDQVGDELHVVGSVENIAPGETIQSTRFVGDRAYVVTFVRTDPLFTIDLSDPTNPTISGELVIPGFSRYLHPIDETHIVGLGQSADESGRVTGIQVSLFDVSDFSNPTRVAVYNVSSRNSFELSLAEFEHHAFSYFPESHILTFPVGISWYWRDDNTTQLEVLRVDPDHGFTHLGEITHNGQALRSVRIEQRLFSIGDDAIRVVQLEKPDEEIATIPF